MYKNKQIDFARPVHRARERIDIAKAQFDKAEKERQTAGSRVLDLEKQLDDAKKIALEAGGNIDKVPQVIALESEKEKQLLLFKKKAKIAVSANKELINKENELGNQQTLYNKRLVSINRDIDYQIQLGLNLSGFVDDMLKKDSNVIDQIMRF